MPIKIPSPPALTQPDPSPPANDPQTTLYPKITAKLKDTLTTLHTHPSARAKPIPFTGTVKLHGTHADILLSAAGHLSYQSRNRTDLSPRSPQTDNQGFAAFCAAREGCVRRVFEQVRRRWCDVHSAAPADGVAVILAGEWIGEGIQKGVAISALSRRWVICSVQVAGVWEAMERYADIADEESGIVNISKGGFYRLELDVADKGSAFIRAARELTAQVTGECPFGKALGVEGKGEGIVWVPAEDAEVPNTPSLWLKTKGEDFAVSSYKPKLAVDQGDLKARGRAFAEANCTEVRLEQGLQYLDEMGIERDMRSMGGFLSWLMKDIETEEKREIEEMALGGAWKAEVNRIAKPWFERKIRER